MAQVHGLYDGRIDAPRTRRHFACQPRQLIEPYDFVQCPVGRRARQGQGQPVEFRGEGAHPGAGFLHPAQLRPGVAAVLFTMLFGQHPPLFPIQQHFCQRHPGAPLLDVRRYDDSRYINSKRLVAYQAAICQ